MSKRSPFSIRAGRPVPGHRGIAQTDAARELLAGDYPLPVKMRVVLASRGALSGKRLCLVCQQVGHITRVYVPVEALRVDQPSYGGIRSYWLCFEHAELPENDPVLTGALARRI